MRRIFAASCFISFWFLLTGTGCAKNNSNQSKYGDDSLYFMGLLSLNSGDFDDAKRLFRDAQKKAGELPARRAMERLCALGSVKERSDACRALYERFHDDDALLVLCRELYQEKEFAKVIALTNEIQLSSCANETAFYRLSSMLKKKDTRFLGDFYSWCVSRPFTNFQYTVYDLCLAPQNSEKWEAIKFRANAYKKNYTEAAESAKFLMQRKSCQTAQIFSDAGKCFLYSGAEPQKSVEFLSSMEDSLPSECKFYTAFYRGRICEKSGQGAAAPAFLEAIRNAPGDSERDNAIWYFLNSLLKNSVPRAIDALEEFAPQWTDASYFDDFFDNLSVRLFSLHMLPEFYRVANLIQGKASSESSAKFSYIAALLIENDFIKPEKNPAAERKRLLQSCATSLDLYYRFLALSKLNYSAKEIERNILQEGPRVQREIDSSAEQFLFAYADFGLPEFINDEYQKMQDRISISCVEKLAGFLRSCGEDSKQNSYLNQSIRMASRRLFAPEGDISRALMSLAFPRNFSSLVHEYCANFSQEEFLIYGLIRSESFFDSAAVSHAGAIGLTQLMKFTAADIARKLRVPEYDLLDPATNIRFGTSYFRELRERLDDSPILAVFSYNSGISRVRNWAKSAGKEFGRPSIPNDLFLEALPFAETREYGRKVISAAAAYAWLYYQKPPSQTAATLMRL